MASTDIAERTDRSGVGDLKITGLELLNENGETVVHPQSGKELVIRLHYQSFAKKEFKNARFSVVIQKEEVPFMLLVTDLVDKRQLDISGDGHLDFIIPRLPLSKGIYHITTFLEAGKDIQDWVHGAAEMNVIDGDFYGTGRLYPKHWAGKNVLVDHSWRISQR